ncbi:peptidoglycan recognition protein family protein [Streptomyces sp. 7N604]|uniref:peptidoglycan recognition protein family protein n=1 Tax=Streptomyces sp. 7N604 TaxID=3457415 RepID=UPI003FD28D29
MHYTGSFELDYRHFECRLRVRSIQDKHMDTGEKYADIGYYLLVCKHGVVFEGRGKNAQNAANGNPELNRSHFAVCALTGHKGYTDVPQAMITGLQDAIAYLRRHGAGWEIAGHRDGYATECPGDLLYGHVLNGTLDPGVLWDGGHHIVKAGETLGEIGLQYKSGSRVVPASRRGGRHGGRRR